MPIPKGQFISTVSKQVEVTNVLFENLAQLTKATQTESCYLFSLHSGAHSSFVFEFAKFPNGLTSKNST